MRCLPGPRWSAALLTAVAMLAVAACHPAATTPPGSAPSGSTTGPRPPNVVFILTDDLSWNLVRYMPQVQQMQRDGTTFTNYTVTDSLCCPSRSSIFTGRFPHDTGVFTNTSPDGGFALFHWRGEESSTYATALFGRSYATGMMGKYLNGYQPANTEGETQPFVPPGWTEWDVAGNGYPEFGYDLNQNHTIVHYGRRSADYLTDVLSRTGAAFIARSAASHKPFALEIATFAPHAPYTPAPRDLNAFPGLAAPRTAAFDRVPTNAPAWLASEPPLTAGDRADIDASFRKRAQAVAAIDRLIASVRATVAAAGVADNTYLFFSSDNGYHMGEYRLTPGKQTAFDTDVRVPLVVVGPGVPAGATRNEIVQNIDLAPTFEQLAGAPISSNVDGHSLLPLLHAGSVIDWRTAALIEHHGPNTAPSDPDVQGRRNGNPTTYEAMRTSTYTYVEYVTGEREYYDRVADPDELDNIAGRLGAGRLAALHAALQRMRTCRGGDACWAAGHVSAQVG